MTTKTKPTIDVIADAVHSIPAPAQAPEYAAPPIGILPEQLHNLVDELEEAHRVLAHAEAARAVAAQAARDAKARYKSDLFDAVRNGTSAADVTNTETAAAEKYEHARQIKKAAESRVAAAHYDLTTAVREHRDEILQLIAPVAEADTADERTAAAALADARARLSAVRGIQQWLNEAEPGAKLKSKRPYRV